MLNCLSKQLIRSFSTKKLANVSLKTAIPCGGLAGTLGALCGVGGGLVIIPVLKQFSKLTVHQITATSLFSISIASSVGAASYISQGKARVPEAALIALSAMTTAGLGAKAATKMSGNSLTKLLALTMMLSVPAVLLKAPSIKSSAINNSNNSNNSNISNNSNNTDNTIDTHTSDDRKIEQLEDSIIINNIPKENQIKNVSYYLGKGAPTSRAQIPEWLEKNWGYSVLGLFVGFSSSLLGVGGGIVMTTYMSVMTDLTQHEAVATSLVAMVPTGMSATFWHMRAGNVHTKAALMIGGACAVSMYGAATYIAPHVSEATMRKIFAGVLSVASLRMIF